MRHLLATIATLLLLAAPLLAQEPPEEEEYDIKKALKEVSEMLTKAESLLVKAIQPRGDPEEAARATEEALEAIEKLLRASQEQGQKAIDKMTEILVNAPQAKGKGQGQDQSEPNPEDDQKAKEKEQEVQDRDPKNSADGDPKDGRENEADPNKHDTKPPDGKTGDGSSPDPEEEWLANLPEKVRQAYRNGNWEVIPERWRLLIQLYTTRMSEEESDE